MKTFNFDIQLQWITILKFSYIFTELLMLKHLENTNNSHLPFLYIKIVHYCTTPQRRIEKICECVYLFKYFFCMKNSMKQQIYNCILHNQLYNYFNHANIVYTTILI